MAITDRPDATRFEFLILSFCLVLIVNFTSCRVQKKSISEKEITSSNVSPNTIAINQPDGTTIHIIGRGSRQAPYTETIDGYTILKNQSKIYEYATVGSDGTLVLSGVKAHDPEQRSKKDQDFLKSIKAHLRNGIN